MDDNSNAKTIMFIFIFTFGVRAGIFPCDTNHRTTCGNSKILCAQALNALTAKGDPLPSQPSVTSAKGVLPSATAVAADWILVELELVCAGSIETHELAVSPGLSSSHKAHTWLPVT